ncbi:MAG: cysteine--tRNA ligase [Candidatus Altiarchaeales archaeon WOR_SM1_79]|nr:MAG: cysteine--tRNA ligase [Candidatus Altiarchaeales archaeon WOR_SM1_79]
MLKVYNTLTRKKEEFVPRENGKVKMFVCGPTVYDWTHLGHAKSYIGFDVIARYLRYRGYDVFYIQNITDIEDRLIKRANEKDISVKELAEEFTQRYYDDMNDLNVTSIDKYEYATDYIPQIIEQIQGLAERGYAYEIDDGVYFDVSRFEEYGKLIHRSFEDIMKDERVSRIEPNPQKENEIDFSLWKKKKPKEPAWDSPWGEGRPGWHIEDTAISITNFGPQYDIHGGGEDLIFPHHEAEIAQAEALTGKIPFVRYWLHNRFLLVEGQKMSKSLGNYITVRDAITRHDADVVRFFFTFNPYYRPIDFAADKIEEARKKLEKIRNTAENLLILLEAGVEATGETDAGEIVEDVRKRIIESMDDNFNTADALAVIFDFVRCVNNLFTTGSLDRECAREFLGFLEELEDIYGVRFIKARDESLTPEQEEMIKRREKARAAKNWKEADEIRKVLKAQGIILEDSQEGTVWKKEK